MIRVADAKYQITALMLKTALKLKCVEKTILRALHENGVWFHKLAEK